MSVATDAETWRPILLHHVWRLCSDPESAVQDGLLRCWMAEQRDRQINRAYAFCAVYSAAVDQRRKDARYEPLPTNDPPGPEHDWDAGQEAERLLAAMEPRQAEALRKMAAGYSGEEIGRDLGCSENAVRRLVFRGRARARKVA